MRVRWRRTSQKYSLQAPNPPVPEVGAIAPASFEDSFEDETAEVGQGASGGYEGCEEHVRCWHIPVAEVDELEGLGRMISELLRKLEQLSQMAGTDMSNSIIYKWKNHNLYKRNQLLTLRELGHLGTSVS